MANSVEQPKLNKNGDRRGIHPNSRANLQPPRWKPGQSGNPEGLSLKRRVSDVLRDPLKSLSKEDAKRTKAIELLAQAIVQDAIKGSKEDRKEIWERLDGKVIQGIAGAGDGPIEIKVIYTQRRNDNSNGTQKANPSQSPDSP